MQKKRGFRLISAVISVIFLFSGCGDGNSRRSKPNNSNLPEIIVGVDNYPPYNYEDANGQQTGIDVDLATEAFGRIGYKPVFVIIDWENKKKLVEDGNIDCIWSSFSIDGREDQYTWTKPYMYSHQVVAVRNDSDIYTLADLAGKRIAIQSTTKPEEIFLSHSDPRIPEVDEIFSLQTRELIFPYLSKGYADAIAAHEPAILQCMKDYNLHYRILDEALMTVGLGVAFSKYDNRGIADKLSDTFDQMNKEGVTEQIIGKYLSDPHKYMEVNYNED